MMTTTRPSLEPRRTNLKHILFAALLLLCAFAVAADQRKPNIIFILADDWGYGDLGCYGHRELKTPNLDALAAQGTRFTQFYTSSGVCSPTRTSVLTGHFPARHRIHQHFAGPEHNQTAGMPNWLDPNLHMLPRLLQKAGYKTAHYGKWHLGGGGAPHGVPEAPDPAAYGYDDARVWNGNGPTWNGTNHWPTTRFMRDDKVWIPNSSRIAVDETIAFITRHRKGPFFVNLWLKDPHLPLSPTAEQRAPYRDVAEPEQTYYAVLTDADYHIGRLMRALDQLGLARDTLVIFSSDNGPENIYPDLGSAGTTGGLRGRKRSLYEGGVRVPFIVRWPNKTPVGRVDETSVMSVVDLLPTFCKLAGAKIPKDLQPDGEDIAAALRGKKFSRSKPLFWEWRIANLRPNSKDSPMLAIRDGQWKLLMNPNRNRIELYDIPRDAAETENLAERHPQIVERLSKQLLSWHQALPK